MDIDSDSDNMTSPEPSLKKRKLSSLTPASPYMDFPPHFDPEAMDCLVEMGLVDTGSTNNAFISTEPSLKRGRLSSASTEERKKEWFK